MPLKSKLWHVAKHALIGGTAGVLLFAAVLLPAAWLAHHWVWRESIAIAAMAFGFGAVFLGFLSTSDL